MFLLRRLFRTRDERAAALVTVVVLLAVCFTAIAVVTSTSIFGQQQATADQAQLQALAAAEAGRDAVLAGVVASPQSCSSTSTGPARPVSASLPDVTYAAWVSGGCPTSTTFTIESVGRAPGAVRTIRATYPFIPAATLTSTITNYVPVTTTTTTTTTTGFPAVLGAIIQGDPGSAALNLPTVVTKHGDLLVASTGAFDCNSNSVIDGDLIVPNGSVKLSNRCQISGSIYAKGNIQLNNLGNRVGGDVVSAAGDVTIGAGGVDGSVQAGGTVTILNGVVIGGDVLSAGTGQSSLYNIVVQGSVSIGGTFNSLQATTVNGNVSATGAGANKVTSDTTIKGNLKLAGTITTANGGPTVLGTTTTKASGMTKPVVTSPAALGRPTWLEIPWTKSAWTSAGWAVRTATLTQCDYQNNDALVAAVNALTVPTVIDTSACVFGLNLYGVTFNLKTDVTFIAPAPSVLARNSAQYATVNVAPGSTGTRTFNLIVPDTRSSDNAPTCPLLAGSTTIYGITLADGVSGIAYSPCTLAFGTATWNGQIVAGDPNPAGGNVTVDYRPVPVPGATNAGGPQASATVTATATTTTTTTKPVTTSATSTSSPTIAPSPSILAQVEP